ncbi:MAG: RimK/LysX family protein [Verrucomicrobiota bacterium]
MPRSYKAIPELVESPSKELAASLGLPWKGAGMPRLVIGRREWISLPELGVSPMNAKTDSGARSSCIHAENVELAVDEKSVKFTTTNHYNDTIACEAAVVRTARVRSSTGKAKKRIFIETTAMLPGGFTWSILISLADRSEMQCPMLLGRRALAGYFLIDPQGAHLLGPRRELPKL